MRKYHNLGLEELGYVEGDGEGDDGDDVLEEPPPQRPRARQRLVVVWSGLIARARELLRLNGRVQFLSGVN